MRAELLRRSLVKATTYRLLIMALDFATIYFLTGAPGVSLGFVIASNVYTTLAYIGHERLWAHVQWGILGPQSVDRGAAAAGLPLEHPDEMSLLARARKGAETAGQAERR